MVPVHPISFFVGAVSETESIAEHAEGWEAAE
jgi:hypothetical protein